MALKQSNKEINHQIRERESNGPLKQSNNDKGRASLGPK